MLKHDTVGVMAGSRRVEEEEGTVHGDDIQILLYTQIIFSLQW